MQGLHVREIHVYNTLGIQAPIVKSQVSKNKSVNYFHVSWFKSLNFLMRKLRPERLKDLSVYGHTAIPSVDHTLK